MYELTDPMIEKALINRAKSGVDVRVILNEDYEGLSENAAAMTSLRAGSVHAVWARFDQIFHAKYLVVDNAVVYIGTGNFVPSDYSSTRDFWVSDVQRADVSAVVATFNQDFRGAGAPGSPSGGLVWSPGSTQTLVNFISSAHRSLLVENEEMDSSPIEQALISAARRGVDVEVVMTEDSEWTDALDRLASSGVHVRLLDAAQIYIHAKVLCVDCSLDSGTVFIGSENFSTSSLVYNRELGVITTTLAAVRAVRDTVLGDFASGTAVVTYRTTTPSVYDGTGLTITSVLTSITPGGYESLTAHTSAAGQSCALSVVLPSGYVSQSSGLGVTSASAVGNLSWHWRIGTSTDPGTATATVSCGSTKVSRSFTIT
jgi:phosphatidylserine/phosphatidylglycerophosphate/cardiolipin synthase-like enzyme